MVDFYQTEMLEKFAKFWKLMFYGYWYVLYNIWLYRGVKESRLYNPSTRWCGAHDSGHAYQEYSYGVQKGNQVWLMNLSIGSK